MNDRYRHGISRVPCMQMMLYVCAIMSLFVLSGCTLYGWNLNEGSNKHFITGNEYHMYVDSERHHVYALSASHLSPMGSHDESVISMTPPGKLVFEWRKIMNDTPRWLSYEPFHRNTIKCVANWIYGIRGLRHRARWLVSVEPIVFACGKEGTIYEDYDEHVPRMISDDDLDVECEALWVMICPYPTDDEHLRIRKHDNWSSLYRHQYYNEENGRSSTIWLNEPMTLEEILEKPFWLDYDIQMVEKRY